MAWSLVLTDFMDLLIWIIQNAEKVFQGTVIYIYIYIYVLGHIEFDVAVRHQGGGLEGKWDMDSQSVDRSN